MEKYTIFHLQSISILGSEKAETLAATAFCELHYLVKFAIFTVNGGLYTLVLSDMHLFHNFFLEPESKVKQPIVLCVLIALAAHLDKTVVSPGMGAYVKGEDALLQ